MSKKGKASPVYSILITLLDSSLQKDSTPHREAKSADIPYGTIRFSCSFVIILYFLILLKMMYERTKPEQR
jgi:hypothetical protein